MNQRKQRTLKYQQSGQKSIQARRHQHDPARVYGMEFAGLEVHFTVDGETLTVTDITRR